MKVRPALHENPDVFPSTPAALAKCTMTKITAILFGREHHSDVLVLALDE